MLIRVFLARCNLLRQHFSGLFFGINVSVSASVQCGGQEHKRDAKQKESTVNIIYFAVNSLCF